MKKYPKNKRNLLLFGGEVQNLGGEISSPKGPEKSLSTLHFVTHRPWLI